MSKHTEGTDPTRPIGNRNPPKATQFGQKDADPRASGVWRKEDTPRYKLEQMITLTKAEIQLIIDDSTAPMFERQLADAIMHADWNILYTLIKDFSEIDLSPEKVSNIKMGYVFEELVRKFSEANNAETGEYISSAEYCH